MPPRICLSMIVRNEAHVVARCLDSARPILDAVVVSDTGSTDGTPDVVRAWLSREGLPGQVVDDPFVDFAQNRTRAMRAARALVRSQGWDDRETYILFLDADMVLEVGAAYQRDQLRADVYHVQQRNGTLQYANIRLVRASVGGEFVGATHEYFSVPRGTSEETLGALTIDDRNDGGSRADKYERDRRLLEAELARDPGSRRAMFYLAQTYQGLGQLAKALTWYRRRTEAGGWEQEAWYAQYAIGMLLRDGGAARAAFRALAVALRRNRARPEPYFELASLLRGRKHHRWATLLALAGLNCPAPGDDSLFLDRYIVDWGLLAELSISAYYAGDWEAGRDANECLALGIDAPPGLADLACQNAVFYADALPDATYRRIAPDLPDTHAPCNPSLIRTDAGYLLNCRAVSYGIDAYQDYYAMEPDGILRTRNALMQLDRDLRLVSQFEVKAELRPLREQWVRGLEDCRLFSTPTATGFTCTTTELHPAGPIRMSLCTLDPDGRVRTHAPLHGYHDDRPQKNWLPFWDAATEELRAVYGYEPLVVLRLDTETGRCEPVLERPQGRRFAMFRGSAGPVPLPDEAGGGCLLVVHFVAFHQLRCYLHRFLRIDADWRVTAASAPFFFHHRGIEFAAGACLSHDGDLLLTFGVEDREAWLGRVPLRVVQAMLYPLPSWPPTPRRGSITRNEDA